MRAETAVHKVKSGSISAAYSWDLLQSSITFITPLLQRQREKTGPHKLLHYEHTHDPEDEYDQELEKTKVTTAPAVTSPTHL